MRLKKPRNKYDLYETAVQAPDQDIQFLTKTFFKLKKKKPLVLREDFCGTFALAREWVLGHPKHRAYAYDLDPEPLAFGAWKASVECSEEQRSRLVVKKQNVLLKRKPLADVIVAMNFSYFIFKERATLKAYFASCLRDLKPGGILCLDAIGGTTCLIPNTFVRRLPGYKYIWDLESYDPIKNNARFAIHFQEKGRAVRKRAFTYDWRLWSIPEIRDLMEDVGFRRSSVYWEGADKNGVGNGIFTQRETGEACETWIAYIVGEK